MGPVSPLTRRTAAVLAWAFATMLAGTVAWAAVGALGGPGGAVGTVLSQADAASALVAERAALAAASASPTGTPTASPTPTVTVSPTTEPPPATTEPVPPTEIARIWPVNGGQVSASCSGPDITLLYATPADGWGVETKNAGPQELEVEFDRHDSETKVRASCVDGTPQMTSTESGDGGGGDGD